MAAIRQRHARLRDAAGPCVRTARRAAIPAAGSRDRARPGNRCRRLPRALRRNRSRPALSPIVLAGTVRMIEFALIVLVGLAIYVAYVVPIDGFEWHYVARHPRHRRARDAGVPGRRHLPGAGVPRLREAVFPARLGLVGGVPASSSASRSSPRPATSSRASGSAPSTSVGLLVLIAFRRALFLLVRRWTREGRLDRRTVIVGADERGEALIDVARRAARLRRPHHRRVRRPQRRPLADRRRRPAEARHRRRPRRVRPPHPHRSRDLLAADHGREPHPADAQEAVGAAGRHPARRAHRTSCGSARAPIPTSATCRCSTSSTSRSPTGTW